MKCTVGKIGMQYYSILLNTVNSNYTSVFKTYLNMNKHSGMSSNYRVLNSCKVKQTWCCKILLTALGVYESFLYI